MNDLISRQAAIDLIMGQPPETNYPSWYAEQIKGLPSAEPERKTRKWIDDGTEFGCCCLECNFTLDDLFIGDLSEVHLKVFPRFCPNCGARMDMRGDRK